MALILASTSPIRQQMLRAAGVAFEPMNADVDENQLKAGLDDPVEIAGQLAEAKAIGVSTRFPEDWVIGSDSVVSVDGRLFDKPRDRQQAAEHLRFFSGKPMRLTSAVALAHAGNTAWTHVETASLVVRPLGKEFIETYLNAEWPEVGYCVGVFRMEGRGVQLFERIEGDHFTILGLPLLALLGALRERGLLAS